MDEIRSTGETTDIPDGTSLLEIPEEHVEKVLAYLASLQQEEAEVAGYATSVPTMSTAKGGRGTNCRTTNHIASGISPDISCSDYMSWT